MFLKHFFYKTVHNIESREHRRRIIPEKKAKVVAAGLGKYLNTELTIYQQEWFEEKFLREHPVWKGARLLV